MYIFELIKLNIFISNELRFSEKNIENQHSACKLTI